MRALSMRMKAAKSSVPMSLASFLYFFAVELSFALNKITSGRITALIKPCGSPVYPPIACATACEMPRPLFVKALPAIQEASSIASLAFRSSPCSQARLIFSTASRNAPSAITSEKLLADLDTKDSTACVTTSIPQAAVMVGGIETVKAG